MILTVRDLEVTFRVGPWFYRRPIVAVSRVSFSLRAGEIYAIVGESGSGKTTLAHAINGLQKTSGGEVRFLNKKVDLVRTHTIKSLRRHMSMIFQDPVGSLSPRMRVGDLIAEPFIIHKIKRDLKEEVHRLLSLVGLSGDFADRYPHQLSGGQARRVGVARAIALDPQLVIADEPTAGLDVSVQGEVLNLLNDLRERLGLTMIFISHNLHVVHHIADRMAVMYLGRIVETGRTEEIFRAPAHPYTATLLSATPNPDPDKVRKRISLNSEVPSLLNRPKGCEFHPRCPWVQKRCSRETPYHSNQGQISVACHTPLQPGTQPPSA
ncbi:MAG: ABC transporter ATP-binding protein [Gammaproteobacteria bacterium]|nr:ABC transporter ATP-binding protein [Gammaproteobacteria bacterium]MCY4219101.1 ABC transporter ATP-binding protein [Gammaproteobacteria bacterium]MCY4276085.1 ABC transporter ATP-binding protein [Gammaproteobacteria bacterium]